MSDALLIVEGPDDKHVMYSFFEALAVENRFEVRELDGIDQILSSIETLIKATNRLGIIVDADLNISSRWLSLSNRVKKSGFILPTMPDLSGTYVKNSDGDVLGIWLMPNNLLPGMLEDFLKMIIPDNDLLFPIVSDFVENFPPLAGRFSEKHKSKALIHAYLAVTEDPGLRFGTAVKAKYLDASKPEVRGLVDWVNRVLVYLISAEGPSARLRDPRPAGGPFPPRS